MALSMERRQRYCITTFMLSLMAAFLLLLTGCGGMGSLGSLGGFGRDGPPSRHVNVNNIPDAVPRHEPITKRGNKSPYRVRGKTYWVRKNVKGFRQNGVASWYGNKFHGQKTSNGETYSMYKMTAAHKSLPIPSYVRVTNLKNGRKVIVRVNDRGPFHGNRIIDLSYVAAKKLDYLGAGTAHVLVEVIDPASYRGNVSPNQRVAQNTSQRRWQPRASSKPKSKPKSTAVSPQVVSRQSPPTYTQPAAKAPVVRAPNPQTFLQVGVFSTPVEAAQLSLRLQDLTPLPVQVRPVKQADPIYKVLIGPVTDDIEMMALKGALKYEENLSSVIVQN